MKTFEELVEENKCCFNSFCEIYDDWDDENTDHDFLNLLKEKNITIEYEDSEDCITGETILYFSIKECGIKSFYAVHGTYSSYDGLNFEGAWNSYYEVQPYEATVIKYKKVKK